MARLRFGYIQMHEGYDPEKHNAYFSNGENETYIAAVDNLDQACQVAQKWVEQNLVDLIELCGAFGEKGAEKINAACQDKVPVGFAIHSASQNEKYEKLFGNHK